MTTLWKQEDGKTPTAFGLQWLLLICSRIGDLGDFAPDGDFGDNSKRLMAYAMAGQDGMPPFHGEVTTEHVEALLTRRLHESDMGLLTRKDGEALLAHLTRFVATLPEAEEEPTEGSAV